MRKHRFAKNHAPQIDAVKTSGELSIDPRFNAVCVTCIVQGTVGVDHFGNDPGAVLIGPGRCGTGFNDRPKGFVDPDFAIWVIAKVDQPFA